MDSPDAKIAMLRHTVATLAYRARKPLTGAPAKSPVRPGVNCNSVSPTTEHTVSASSRMVTSSEPTRL